MQYAVARNGAMGAMGCKGVIIVCLLQFCLVAVMARRVLAP